MSLKLKKKTEEDDDTPESEVAHMKSYGKYYTSKVLNYERHWRMVQNLPFYAEQAGVPEYFIYHSCLDILSDDEQAYIQNFEEHPEENISGGYFLGGDDYIDKMYSMIGVLLRNYISAKFMTLQDLIKAIKAGHPPKDRLVCIPNFALDKSEGGNVPAWELANVLGWMLNQHSHGKQVIIYVEHMQHVSDQYGKVLRNHIENHFVKF